MININPENDESQKEIISETSKVNEVIEKTNSLITFSSSPNNTILPEDKSLFSIESGVDGKK